MTISKKYSHLNGEEYLLVHKPELYEEIKRVIQGIDASVHRTKVSKERTKTGQLLYNPKTLNSEFKTQFERLGWEDSRYNYYITLDRVLMEKSLNMSAAEQKAFFVSQGETDPIFSYNQTDFVKEGIAIEVQFGKYAFVAFDLFVKHMLFYTGGVINLGIEVLPTKTMQSDMSSGPAYFEGEVYNVLRQGRSSPPVPLLVLGIEP
jgi:hypothetical protein